MLSDKEIDESLSKLEGWERDGEKIRKIIPMHNWKGVMMLANAIAHISECAWHHPDLLLTYSSITIYLTSHDKGRITKRDIDLASKIEEFILWSPQKTEGGLEGTPNDTENRYLK